MKQGSPPKNTQHPGRGKATSFPLPAPMAERMNVHSVNERSFAAVRIRPAPAPARPEGSQRPDRRPRAYDAMT